MNRYGTPTSAYQKRVARLCLRSVKKIGVDLKEDSPPYVFDYYTGSSNADDFVPPPFFYAHDIWGYYNGNNSKAYLNSGIQEIPLDKTVSQLDHNMLKGLCFLKEGAADIVLNPKDGYAKNGLLRQIIYPTGGTLTYEYEQNRGTFLNSGTETTVGGVHVSKTNSTDGGYSNGCANPISTQYLYVVNGSGSASSMWGLEKPVNTVESGMHYAAEYKVFKWKLSKPFGYCDYKYKFPGILSLNQSVGISDFQKLMTAMEPVLGILSFVSTVMDVVTVACGASGFWAWAAVVVDIVGGLITLGVSCLSNNTKDGTSVICYNFDLNTVSPLPAQFKRVEVIEGTGGIGKTVQEFTSSDDYSLWAPDNPNFTARQRFAPWAYGLPKITTVYDKDDNKIKQTENVYDFYNAQGIIDEICWHCPPPDNDVWSTLVSCKCLVKRSSSQRNVDWTNPDFYEGEDKYTISSIPDMAVELYPMYTGRAELLRTHERVFKINEQNQYVETVTNYQYNSGTPNYDVNSISTTQSNGDSYYKYISYSGDFTGGAFDAMNAQNMVSVPVVTREQVSSANGGLSGYVTERVTEFTQLGNGDIKPLRTLEERTDRPNNSSWTFYNGPNSTDYSKFKVMQAFTYDAAGNLVSAKEEGNRVITNVYGYSDKYVVASVINADPATDNPAYSSFEVEGSNGGWQLTGSTSALVAGGVTGDWSFNLNGNSFSATLNTAKSYLLSFWANNSNVVVTGGAALRVSAPTINGFTYYQYDIAAGTSSVTVNGNSYIDELRLYPSTARMRTVTYDPLIGKTSECDENNRVTYYEYDNLARLRFIKDENKNIVKMYEYNNVSKQNGCPGIYYNRMIKEIFTKSNCGSGYLGEEITYTVPADKYSSTISQEDADAQAETEILAYGQTNADNAPASSGCKLLYYNTQQSKNFTTETCPDGYEGGTVTYTVPANKYFTTIDQATANQMAIEEVDANGQAYANDSTHAVCNLDTNAVWEWKEGDPSYCANINGQLPAHLFMWATNVNPNSAGFGSKAWKDAGPSDLCPSNLFYNTDQSGDYYSQVCTGGQAPNPYPVSVPPGTFSSTVSVQYADSLARQNAQTQANQNGTCGVPNIPVYYDNQLGGPITIEFWDAVNLKRYTLIAYGHDSGTLGEIPAGTYTVTITLPNSPGGYFYVEACDWYQEGPSPMIFGTFYISSSCNFISIY